MFSRIIDEWLFKTIILSKTELEFEIQIGAFDCSMRSFWFGLLEQTVQTLFYIHIVDVCMDCLTNSLKFKLKLVVGTRNRVDLVRQCVSCLESIVIWLICNKIVPDLQQFTNTVSDRKKNWRFVARVHVIQYATNENCQVLERERKKKLKKIELIEINVLNCVEWSS